MARRDNLCRVCRPLHGKPGPGPESVGRGHRILARDDRGQGRDRQTSGGSSARPHGRRRGDPPGQERAGRAAEQPANDRIVPARVRHAGAAGPGAAGGPRPRGGGSQCAADCGLAGDKRRAATGAEGAGRQAAERAHDGGVERGAGDRHGADHEEPGLVGPKRDRGAGNLWDQDAERAGPACGRRDDARAG